MIWIESYYRIRNGRIHIVRGHFRSLPDSGLPPVAFALTHIA